MQLIDITEPNDNNDKTNKPTSFAVGIDLGTTNSLVAYSEKQSPYIIPTCNGASSIASIVEIKEDGAVNIGNSVDSSGHVIKSIKRLMGKTSNEIQDKNEISPVLRQLLVNDENVVKLCINGRNFTPIEISAQILKELKQNAEQNLGLEVTQAVITVPAYFDDAARGATKDAARLAGLEALRLISEPTAAAYAYGLENKSEGYYLVYDLGGGTFDVSLLQMRMGVFKVVATSGDAMLGGDDIDHLLAQFLLKKLSNVGVNIDDTARLQEEILLQARNIKEAFAKDTEVKAVIAGQQITVTYPEFLELIQPILNKTYKIFADVIMDSEVDASDIKGIILVGGSTRIKAIPKTLQDKFNIPILNDVDPDKIVALGAALQAENLTQGLNNLLIDVTPLSLGIEMMGGVVEKLIPRNSPIPTSVSQEFTTYADNQNGMKFHVVQGDRELAKNCRSLANFELKNIPPMKAGAARIEVNFSVDADGLMFVAATEKTTGVKQEITVKPTYGLDEQDIITMLKDAMYNASDDHNERLLAETVTEAQRVIDALSSALKERGADLISENQLQDINNSVKKLEELLSSNDREAIIKQIEVVEEVATVFIEAKMNSEISSMLKGKDINNYQ